MTETEIKITKLTASKGHTLTNGEIYGKEIYLGKLDSPKNWKEITDQAYGEILAKQEAQIHV